MSFKRQVDPNGPQQRWGTVSDCKELQTFICEIKTPQTREFSVSPLALGCVKQARPGFSMYWLCVSSCPCMPYVGT